MLCKPLCNLFFLLLITSSFHANVFSQIGYKGFPQWSKQQKDSTEYYLYTPSNRKAGEKYPIALFRHGCCGTDYHASLRNCVDPPVRMWHSFGENKQYFKPTYIIAPATSRGWQQHFKNLKAVIDDLIANRNGLKPGKKKKGRSLRSIVTSMCIASIFQKGKSHCPALMQNAMAWSAIIL